MFAYQLARADAVLSLMQILGTKYCLVIGAISHALYAAAHFCSSEFTLYPAGALLGLATGLSTDEKARVDGVCWKGGEIFIITVRKRK